MKTFMEVLEEVSYASLRYVESQTDIAGRESLFFSATELAVIASDAASAFSIDNDPATAVLALNTMVYSIQTLSVSNGLFPSEGSDSGQKSLPQLLPRIHVLWPSFMAAVVRGNAAAFRRALVAICSIASLSSNFLAGRIRAELWPSLRKAALGSQERSRQAAVKCIAELAFKAPHALVGIASEVADVLVSLVCTASIAELSLAAITALEPLDSDAVWYHRLRAGLVALPKCPQDSSLFASVSLV